MMDSREGLGRFTAAQDAPRTGIAVALAELREGHKRSHWIWYVFPQLRGLGTSPMAEHYGIADLDEAAAYLRHPLLRARLLDAASLVLDHQRAGVPLATLMGSRIDVLKLLSSMTLFAAVARRLADGAVGDDQPGLGQLADTADAIIAAAGREGYPPCGDTERRLARDRS
ncbi:MAG TPA: DUF1810 family protein [Vicinamibacterales bacterium]|nr:DUF1810 family protein [Vicinamibacterales bacterium]